MVERPLYLGHRVNAMNLSGWEGGFPPANANVEQTYLTTPVSGLEALAYRRFDMRPAT
jgi:hypothetical protein